MNTSFTPGKWKLISDPCHYDTMSSIVAGERRDTGNRRGSPSWQMQVEVGGFSDFREQEANARLMAAAPELLEMLINSLPYITDVLDNPEQLQCFKPGVVQKHHKAMRVAINLATGQEP